MVSIIVPNFNNEKYIEFTIKSILSQNYWDFELIIVDDKSTDQSVEIIKKMQLSDSRILLIENEINSGRSLSRNKALDCSHGKYIAFCDADDAWCENKLDIAIEIFERDSEVDMLFTDSRIIDANNDLTGETFYSFFKLKKHYGTENIKKKLHIKNFINTPSVVIRNKSSINKIRFDENLNYLEDWKYWYEISRIAKKIEFVDMQLSLYRVHSNNSWKDLTGFYKCRFSIINHILKNSKLTIKMKSELYYNLGTTLLYLHKRKMAEKMFLHSFFASPNSYKSLIRYLLMHFKDNKLR